MPVFGPREVDCFVYVYREGAFSAVGHDVVLRAGDFEIAVDAEGKDGVAVDARFRAGSLRVAGVLEGGRLEANIDERRPSPRDRREIERNVAKDVLEADRYPLVSFRSRSVERTGQGVHVGGALELHGVVRNVGFEVRQVGPQAVARVPIHQPDFRIKPYRALLGALRVKPGIIVELSVLVDLESILKAEPGTPETSVA